MLKLVLEYASYVVTLLSIIFGIVGIVGSRIYIKNWIRLHRESSGKLLTDTDGTNLAKDEFNNKGYEHHLKLVRKRLDEKFGSKGYNVIATPAELDYVFPFLLAHTSRKRFCSIHTSAQWPPQLTRFRYNPIQRGDRVVLVSVILSSGKFMTPAIDMVTEAGATVCGVFSIIEATPSPDEKVSIEDSLLARNVYFDAIYRPL